MKRLRRTDSSWWEGPHIRVCPSTGLFQCSHWSHGFLWSFIEYTYSAWPPPRVGYNHLAARSSGQYHTGACGVREQASFWQELAEPSCYTILLAGSSLPMSSLAIVSERSVGADRFCRGQDGSWSIGPYQHSEQSSPCANSYYCKFPHLWVARNANLSVPHLIQFASGAWPTEVRNRVLCIDSGGQRGRPAARRLGPPEAQPGRTVRVDSSQRPAQTKTKTRACRTNTPSRTQQPCPES